MIALTLAKAGLFGGNPYTVLNTPVDIVIQAFHFNNFMQDYEEASIQLNRKE